MSRLGSSIASAEAGSARAVLQESGILVTYSSAHKGV